MITGSNGKPESKVALTVSILDYNVKNVCSFKYLGVFISADFTWNQHVEHIASKVNQRLGLLKRIKHLLPFKSRLLFYNSIIMPLFDYADLVWGDKHNSTSMASLQILQNKAAKIILDRPLHSSASGALQILKWVPLERRRFLRRCSFIYKCINGLVIHDLSLVKQENHGYNTRNKNDFRLPRTFKNWGQERTEYHAVKDFNSLTGDIRQSSNLNIFKRNILNFILDS